MERAARAGRKRSTAATAAARGPRTAPAAAPAAGRRAQSTSAVACAGSPPPVPARVLLSGQVVTQARGPAAGRRGGSGSSRLVARLARVGRRRTLHRQSGRCLRTVVMRRARSVAAALGRSSAGGGRRPSVQQVTPTWAAGAPARRRRLLRLLRWPLPLQQLWLLLVLRAKPLLEPQQRMCSQHHPLPGCLRFQCWHLQSPPAASSPHSQVWVLRTWPACWWGCPVMTLPLPRALRRWGSRCRGR